MHRLSLEFRMTVSAPTGVLPCPFLGPQLGTDRTNQLLLALKLRPPRGGGLKSLTITEQFLFATPKSRKHLRIRDNEFNESRVRECALDEPDGAHRMATRPTSVLNNVGFTDPADEMAYLVGAMTDYLDLPAISKSTY